MSTSTAPRRGAPAAPDRPSAGTSRARASASTSSISGWAVGLRAGWTRPARRSDRHRRSIRGRSRAHQFTPMSWEPVCHSRGRPRRSVHLHQRRGVDVHADRRLETVVGHPVDVLGAERRAASRRGAPAAPRRCVVAERADRGGALGERAADDHEGPGAAAVVVPVGALTGHPGQQPGLEIRSLGQAGVVAGDRVVGDQRIPQVVLLGETGGDLDQVVAGAGLAGRLFRGRG